jgi:glycosyltransferase involved in cell wall biosynthesis
LIDISIIVPIYNTEKYLSQCLNSLCNQTFQNLEIILINDGSTDNVEEVCNQYSKIDNRIRYYSQENSGPSFTRNRGVLLSSGKYIGFCDSDDVVELNMFAEMLNRAQESDADVVFCDIYSTRDHRNFSLPWVDGTKLSRNSILDDLIPRMIGVNTDDSSEIPLWGSVVRCLFKSEIIKKHSIEFPNKIDFAEDLIFTLTALSYSQIVSISNKILYYYRDNSNSLMNSYNSYRPHMFEKRLLLLKHIQEILIDLNIADSTKRRLSVTARLYFLECIGNACRISEKRNFMDSINEVNTIVNDKEVQMFYENFRTTNKKKLVTYFMIKKRMTLFITIYFKIRFSLGIYTRRRK